MYIRSFSVLMLFILSGCAALVIGERTWITDEFFFNRLNEKRIYPLTIDSFTRPEIVLIDSACNFPRDIIRESNYGGWSGTFDWEIVAEVVENDEIIERQTLTPQYAIESKEKVSCLREIAFNVFESISGKLFARKVDIVITVIKADPRFMNENRDIKFEIRNSTYL